MNLSTTNFDMKKYFDTLIFYLLAGSLLISGFNYFIDPYDIFHSPKINGLNITKTVIQKNMRITKAIAIENIKPNAIVIGSSSSNTGIDPDNAYWPHKPVYNLGLPGTNAYEVVRYVQHAEAVNPLKTIVFIPDFFMFNAYMSNQPTFNEDILKVTAKGHLNFNSVKIYTDLLLSFSALKASLETIRDQSKLNEVGSLKRNGQLSSDFRVNIIEKMNGYRHWFNHSEKYLYSDYFRRPTFEYHFESAQLQVSTLTYYEDLINICRHYHTKLIVVIPPVHVRLLEAINLMGLLPQYLHWRELMVMILDKQLPYFKTNPPVIWDFAEINAYTNESLPEKGDMQAHLRWFWDPRHFKAELGDKILKRIFTNTTDKDPNFGIILNRENIVVQNRVLVRELSRWQIHHRKVIAEIKNILKTSRQEEIKRMIKDGVITPKESYRLPAIRE